MKMIMGLGALQTYGSWTWADCVETCLGAALGLGNILESTLILGIARCEKEK